MSIHQVRENLIKTIEGKEQALAEYRQARADVGYGPGDLAKDAALFAKVEFLKINIDELKRILADVELAVMQYDQIKDDLMETSAHARDLERQVSNMSWGMDSRHGGI